MQKYELSSIYAKTFEIKIFQFLQNNINREHYKTLTKPKTSFEHRKNMLLHTNPSPGNN